VPVFTRAVPTAASGDDNSPGSEEVPRIRLSSWRRNSGSSSGPTGMDRPPWVFLERPAGWRATAASAESATSAATQYGYQVGSVSAGSTSVARPT
jgi:hypothetical protein